MKQLSIRFECDPSINSIEVLIRAPEKDGEVKALMDRLSARPTDTIIFSDGSGSVRSLSMDDIVLVSSDNKLVNIITEHASWSVRRTLQSIEDELDEKRFLRISRYELVNLDKILRYDFTVAGTLRLELTGGMETWAARRCIPEIRRRLAGKRESR